MQPQFISSNKSLSKTSYPCVIPSPAALLSITVLSITFPGNDTWFPVDGSTAVAAVYYVGPICLNYTFLFVLYALLRAQFMSNSDVVLAQQKLHSTWFDISWPARPKNSPAR